LEGPEINRGRATYIEYHPFFRCCIDAIERLENYEIKLRELESKESVSDEIEDIRNKLHMQEVSAPVFAINTAEHFINLYACNRIDSFYTSEHLESLDIFSKWIAIPYIICGEEIDRESQSAKDFKHLISLRNSLTHAKPSYIYFDNPETIEKRYNRLDAKKKDRRTMAKRSANIVLGMFSELKNIDPSEELEDLMKELGIWSTI